MLWLVLSTVQVACHQQILNLVHLAVESRMGPNSSGATHFLNILEESLQHKHCVLDKFRFNLGL